MNTESENPRSSPQPRVQLNARLPAELDQRMRRYQQRTGTTRQALLIDALEYFLDAKQAK